MSIVIILIFVFTLFIWFIGRLFHWKICPICAGISLTWLGMLVVRALDYYIDLSILAMLIGASVVGIAYQLEKKLPAHRSALLWKAIFIPSSFIVGYALVQSDWPAFAWSLGWVSILVYVFFRSSRAPTAKNKQVEELEKRMEQCC